MTKVYLTVVLCGMSGIGLTDNTLPLKDLSCDILRQTIIQGRDDLLKPENTVWANRVVRDFYKKCRPAVESIDRMPVEVERIDVWKP